MTKRLIVVVALLAVLFGDIFGWKYLQIQAMVRQSSMPPPPASVATARVAAEQWRPVLSAVGSLVAMRGVEVAGEFAGQVTAIAFESGQAVEAGALLVQLDDDVDRAELDTLIAAEQLARQAFKRVSSLVERKLASASDYDVARAELDAARAQVAAQRARIRKKAIRAPFAGLLGIRRVELGQYLEPGTPVVSLQVLDPLYADFEIPERFIGELGLDQAVELGVQAYPERSFNGRISAIEPRIKATTRGVRVRATLANPDGHLRPGMFAEVRVLLPRQRQVLTLPARAITYNPYGDSVFVVLERDGQLVVERRQVVTGEVRDGRIEIVSGLAAGDEVVSAGQNKLRNGQMVTIDNSVRLDDSAGPS